ncbi:MAG TPA: sigma-70 family RNA polymerase sigma factor [Syntrophomonas sp.]|nr:sigma-70 family RNA polymerase sigma factor [Syntrophomonas sp.]
MKDKLQQTLVEYVLANQASYYRLAYSYVRNQEDALDVVHESICKAMTAAHSPVDPKEIKPWFYKIVINSALDFLRKNKLVELPGEEIMELQGSCEDEYQDLDLAKALDSLPLNYRSVIVLRYFEDLKIEDIAAILGENVSTVKTRLYAGLKKLRIQLEA